VAAVVLEQTEGRGRVRVEGIISLAVLGSHCWEILVANIVFKSLHAFLNPLLSQLTLPCIPR
jgi:hypothetical protein